MCLLPPGIAIEGAHFLAKVPYGGVDSVLSWDRRGQRCVILPVGLVTCICFLTELHRRVTHPA